MYDTTIAAKLLSQLESFLGRISPHFHKPTVRFIGDMVYGIMAQEDIKLSSIVRALKEKTTPKKVGDRLSRMLSSKGLEEGLQDAIAELGAKKVRKDTLIILCGTGKSSSSTTTAERGVSPSSTASCRCGFLTSLTDCFIWLSSKGLDKSR